MLPLGTPLHGNAFTSNSGIHHLTEVAPTDLLGVTGVGLDDAHVRRFLSFASRIRFSKIFLALWGVRLIDMCYTIYVAQTRCLSHKH